MVALISSQQKKEWEESKNIDAANRRAIRDGANLVIYGKARTGKSTFLRRFFPNRCIMHEFPVPGVTEEPFIFETNEDMSNYQFWGFGRDVHVLNFDVYKIE